MPHRIYHYSQQIEIAERKTDATPVIEEKYTATGLLVVTLENDPKSPKFPWKRSFEDLPLSEESIKTLRGGIRFPMKQVRAMIDPAVAKRRIQFGAEENQLAIRSDTANSSPHIPGGFSMVPYNMPDTPIPIPYATMHWPTITPGFPTTQVEEGKPYKCSFNFTPGGGIFPFNYEATLKSMDEDYLIIGLDAPEQSAASSAGIITLNAKYKGAWEMKLYANDATWRTGKGEIALTVNASMPRGNEVSTIEGLRYKNTFTYEAAPLHIDDDFLITAGWPINFKLPDVPPPPKVPEIPESLLKPPQPPKFP